jgi:DNA-binding NarL/FixJ family response regulator
MIRVSVIEDDRRYRESLTNSLRQAEGLRCVSHHPNGAHALKHLPISRPDVILVDIRLPQLSGIQVVRELRRRFPGCLPIMLTSHGDDELIFEALKAGAVGYLLKRVGLDRIIAAIHEAVDGGSPMTPEIARRVTSFFRQKPSVPSDGEARLTRREQEVLREVALGKASKEIAADLGIALPTVHNHLRHIYDKLEVSSRAGAVAKFLNGSPGEPRGNWSHSPEP